MDFERKDEGSGRPSAWARIRFVLVFVLWAIATLPTLPMYYLYGFVLFPRFFYRYAQSWTILLNELAGARIFTSGLHRPPWDSPFVMVSNHLSYLDFCMAMQITPVPLHFIATRGIAFIPFVGGAMRLMRMIFIDRRSPERARVSMEEAAKKIAAGRHILSYPEGGISRDGRMGSFKKGLFRLAVKAQVPVVPLVVRGTHRVLNCTEKWNVPGRVEMEFLDPIPTTGLSENDVDALADKVRAVMLEAYGDGSLSHRGQEVFKSPYGRDL